MSNYSISFYILFIIFLKIYKKETDLTFLSDFKGIVDILLETAKAYAEQVLYGDQCILNIVLREKAKYYSFAENAQVKYIENIKEQCGLSSVNLDKHPIIIHYTTETKPWNCQKTGLFEREKYWFFRHLDWSYLIMRPNKIL